MALVRRSSVTLGNETLCALVKHVLKIDNRELRSHPSLLPSLEHEDSPKLDCPVLCPTQVFHPLLGNRNWIENAPLPQWGEGS